MPLPLTESPLNTYSNIAVIGAAGKMGSGISLLLLQELSLCRISQQDPKAQFCLTLIDAEREKLDGLRKYLQTHLQKWAEKNIIILRESVKDIPSLISNREIIDTFLSKAMEIAHFATSLNAANHAQLIFEAIIESIDKKTEILSFLKKESLVSPYFLSNTSSIPISVMNEKALLENKIIGFHLYNPPAIQKLIEIIPLDQGDAKLTSISWKIAERLNKTVIFSKDVAGFIGNGYFLREIYKACQVTEQLSQQQGLPESIYCINKITQDFLLRPMGIFQLIDYVGLEVVVNVGNIMEHFLNIPLYSEMLFKPLFAIGQIGGQFSDGSQKNGFFQYEKGQIVGIFDPSIRNYRSLSSTEWKTKCDQWLGNPPMDLSWKLLSKDPNRQEKIRLYFSKLAQEKTPGAQLSMEFSSHLHEISQELVKKGVATTLEEVDRVLENGFYHLYSSSEALAEKKEKRSTTRN